MAQFRFVLAVLAASVAGFFLFAGSMIVFVSLPAAYEEKVHLIGFAICAGIALLGFAVAAALRGFRGVVKMAAILLLSVAAFDAFMVLTFVCMMYSPEIMRLMAEGSQPGAPSFHDLYRSPGAGLMLTAGLAVGGFVLLRLSRPRNGAA